MTEYQVEVPVKGKLTMIFNSNHPYGTSEWIDDYIISLNRFKYPNWLYPKRKSWTSAVYNTAKAIEPIEKAKNK